MCDHKFRRCSTEDAVECPLCGKKITGQELQADSDLLGEVNRHLGDGVAPVGKPRKEWDPE